MHANNRGNEYLWYISGHKNIYSQASKHRLKTCQRKPIYPEKSYEDTERMHKLKADSDPNQESFFHQNYGKDAEQNDAEKGLTVLDTLTNCFVILHI